MGLNGEIGQLVCLAVEFVVARHFEVLQSATILADQMVVGIDVCFESVVGAAAVQFMDQSLILEDGQIAVDGSQAEFGELGFELFIDPVGRGVLIGGTQYLQDTLALPCIPKGSFFRGCFHGLNDPLIGLFFI